MDPQAKLDVLAAEFERLTDRGDRSAPEMGRLVEELRREISDMMRQRRELASLYEVAKDLAAASDLADLLESIIDKAIVLVQAERGFVVLLRGSGERYLAAARQFAEGEVGQAEEAFSSSLVTQVLSSQEPILTTNVQADDRYALSQSIILQDIRSVLAVPLVARGELLGAIYVDTRMATRPFSEHDLRLLQAMASQAAMAIRGARLYQDVLASNAQLQQALHELRDTQDQLVQAERLAAVGRLAASVAHELRSPLTVMRNSIYYLDRLASLNRLDSPDTVRRYLAKIDDEIERQSKIINDLLFFSRNRPRKLVDVDLNSILYETTLRVTMPESVKLELALAELPSLRADADQLSQVFVNLVTNAVQAMPQGGHLQIVSSLSDQMFAQVQVRDTGVGMDADALARLFQPFFTTKEKGIGLGLSVTKSIVEAHRGTIEVDSIVGVGTCFTIKLPLMLIGE
jgi:signal transduction histidine kinase